MVLEGSIEHLSIPMHPWTMEETVARILSRMDAGLFTQHAVVNAAKLVKMQKDAALREAVVGCDVINIDGMGVVWGARITGRRVPERVAGADLFYRLIDEAEKRGDGVYFLGAAEEIVAAAVKAITASHPDLKVKGWHHGYFWDHEKEIVDEIRNSGAAMLFVGITSPLKEQFINRWREQLGVKFAMGVGGTFDVVAGKTKRAPVWMQKMGMEWLFRLIQEPRRLGKRYITTNAFYAFMVIRELGKGRG